MTAEYDNVTTTVVYAVTIPRATLTLLDHLLNATVALAIGFDEYATARDEATAQACDALIWTTLGLYLPEDYAILLDEEARQDAGNGRAFTKALNSLNERNAWAEVDALAIPGRCPCCGKAVGS